MTFLRDFADADPFLLLGERIHFLEQDEKTSPRVVINDVPYGSVSSERIAHLEEIAFRETWQNLLAKKSSKKEEVFVAFCDSFLDYFTNPSRGHIVAPHTEARPYQEGEPSFLEKALNDQAIMFDGCDLRVEQDPSAENLSMLKRSYLLEDFRIRFLIIDREWNLLKLDATYQAIIDSLLEELAEEIEVPSFYGRPQGPPYPGFWQENATGEVGWILQGTDYYLGIKRPSYTYHSHVLGKDFRFPSCVLAVRLVVRDDGVVDYDDACTTGGIRVLSAKRILAGEEVGESASLEGKEFFHPACQRSMGNPYPFLCMNGKDAKGDYHVFHHPDRSEESYPMIRQTLLDAFDRIGTYSDDRNKNHLYCYLDTNYGQFKEHEIHEK